MRVSDIYIVVVELQEKLGNGFDALDSLEESFLSSVLSCGKIISIHY